ARPVPLLVDHRNGGRESREPRRLGDAITPSLARGRLAQLAGAARGHPPTAGAARPRASALERPRLPPPVPVLAARLSRALQPPIGARLVRHRLHRAGAVVCPQRARSGAQRDRARGRGRARAAGRGDPALERPRRTGPLPRQGHSLPRRLGRDAGGAAGLAALVAPLTRSRNASGRRLPAGAARESLTT